MSINVIELLEEDIYTMIESEKEKHVPMKEMYAKCMHYLCDKYGTNYASDYPYIIQETYSKRGVA